MTKGKKASYGKGSKKLEVTDSQAGMLCPGLWAGNQSDEFGSGSAGAERHLLDLGGQESLHSFVALLAGDFPRI